MKFVGYYTDRYTDNAREFMASCARVGVECYCKHVDDRGSWILNTSYKPTFIKECLDTLNTNIIYCDVDARVERYPELFDRTTNDVMFYKGRVWGHSDEEVLSGTMFLRNNEIVKNFVSNWANLCNNNNREWDQRLVVGSLPEGIDVGYLPVEYCAIFDSPMVEGKDIVIRHLQASRQMRQFDRQ
jgi:hypothetical protein